MVDRNKLRVAILALMPGSGSTSYGVRMAWALSRICKVTVVTIPELVKHFGGDIEVRECPLLVNDHRPSVAAYRFAYRTVQDLRPDILHDPEGPQYHWTTPLLACIARRFPLAVTIHVIKVPSGSFLRRRFMHSAVVRINARVAKLIFVTGKSLVDEMVKAGAPPSNVSFVPHGINIASKGGVQDDELTPEPSVLFFGELRFDKGIDRLPHIARLVADRIPNARFIVAGSSEGMKRFDKNSRQQVMDALAEMNHSPLFRVNERHIPDDEVPAIFAKAWVTALPYRGCSQSSLVGLSHNFSRPVVASRVGAIAEIVDDGVTGAVVDPESDEAFAGAIVNLLADKSKCLSMGKAGFDRINKERSWDIVADETLKAYHRVLQAKA